jgi:hypothetical protein
LYGSTLYVSQTVSIGKTYYISASSGNGYRIGFTDSTTPPTKVALPTTNVPTFAFYEHFKANVADGEQWFKFTATAAAGRKTGIWTTGSPSIPIKIELYDSTGERLFIGTRSDEGLKDQNVTAGKEYYICVTPQDSYQSGEYEVWLYDY